MSISIGKKVMSRDLGFLASSERFIEHVVGLCRAAMETGRTVGFFLTGPGVLLVNDSHFPTLIATGARITVWEVSFLVRGLSKLRKRTSTTRCSTLRGLMIAPDM